ncbi:MAG: SPOR domain-containing protein [Campylobacterota bacterium]
MEENKNNKNGNLEDIMIDGGGGQKQLKKILMIIALVIVVLIVAIAVTKLVIGSEEEKQNNQQQEAPVQAPEASQESQALFEEVPIDEESQQADEDLDNMINELRQQRGNGTQQAAAPQQDAPEPVEPQQDEEKQEKQQETQQASQEQPEQEPEQEPEHDPYDVKEGYWYIQVGSFERLSPNEAFLKEIEDKGYKYYYYRTEVNGKQYTKVVLGGYESKDEASAHRKRIRDEINEGAFLLRVQNAQ